MDEILEAAGAVALDEAGRLLVVRRGNPPAQGRWSLPGGRLEPGEDPATCAVREVREETGLEVVVERLLGTVRRPYPGGEYRIHDHLVRVTGGVLRAGDDAAAVAWMGRAELEEAGPTDGLFGFLRSHGVDIAP